MKPTLARVAVAAGVVALALAGVAFAAKPKVGPPPPKLFGAVGMTKQVSLKDVHGELVVKLEPGWYTLTISDASAAQRFKLVGPGVNRATGGTFVGAAIWGVNLRKGTYRYQTVGAKSGTHTFHVA